MNVGSSAKEKSSDVLLVLRADGLLLPIYERALRRAEGWPWQIKRAYTGALLIRSTGAASRVMSVVVERPYGKTPLSRVFSLLNSNWEVALHTGKAEATPKEVVKAICEGLSTDSTSVKSLFDTTEDELIEFRSKVNDFSMEDIFHRLHLLDPEFVALDSL